MGDRRDRDGGTVYATSHLCVNCAKLIANSGVHRVVVLPDTEADWRNPWTSYKLLEECGIEVLVMVQDIGDEPGQLREIWRSHES